MLILAIDCTAHEGSQAAEPANSPEFEFRRKEPPVLPPAVVIDSTEYVLPREGRSIIVERISPPAGFQVPIQAAPPIPVPAASSLRWAEAEARATRKVTKLCHFSCAVFDEKFTMVRWTHEGRRYAAWSSINWNHIAGLPSFDSSDGTRRYGVILGMGNYRSDKPHPFTKSGALPAFAENEVRWEMIEGDPADAAAMENLIAIHEIYRQRGQVLKQQWEIRERARKAKAEWLKANPPQPHDIRVRHWEIAPARDREGGAP